MMKRFLFGALMIAAGGSYAQSTPAPAMPLAPSAASPAKKELVRKVLVLQQSGVDAVAQSLAQQPLTRLLLAANQTLQTRVAADKRADVAKSIDAEARKYLDEVTPMLRERATRLAPGAIGPILEQRFTEDELRQLVAWLESPVNKKYAEMASEIQTALAQQIVADSRTTIEPKLKALEVRISGLLGLPPPRPAAGASAPASVLRGGPKAAAPAASKP